MSKPTTSTAMSAARSTRESQLPRPKKSPPPSFSSFFSLNKSSAASLRSSKPAEMPNPPPRTRMRRTKRNAVRDQPSKRVDAVVPAPKIEEVLVTPVERPDVFAFMEEEQADDITPEREEVNGNDEEEATEERALMEEAVEKEADKVEAYELEADGRSAQNLPFSNSSPTRSETGASEDSQRTRVEEYILQASSFHSDSGISMGSGSSEYSSPVLSYKVPHINLPSTRAGDVDVAPPTRTTTSINEETDEPLGREVDEEPEAFYASARQLHFDIPHQRPAIASRPPLPRSFDPGIRRSKPQQEFSQRGYDLLASNISSNNTTPLKPLYRRFEAFNNRRLLYLQDEITEMEEELRELDTAIAQESGAMGHRIASRRGEARIPSQLQWRRLELLTRSFAKVEQYNCALSSYSKLAQNVELASHTDITIYRNWIAMHTPIASSETRFLDNEADLLSVGSAGRIRKCGTAEGRVVTGGYGLLVLILIFKVTPQIIARLVISAIMGLVALFALCPSVLTDLRRLRKMGRVIGLYATLMLVLSVVIS